MIIKKYILPLLAAAAFTACSSDEPKSSSDNIVTFHAQLPADISTRAFGDAKQAVNLQYAVYNLDNNKMVDSGTATFTNGVCDLSLQLVVDMDFKVIFYADAFGKDNAESPYTFSATDEATTLSVDYAKLTTNNEAFDAFFAVDTVQVVRDMPMQNITLARALAQVNIAASADEMQTLTKDNTSISQTAVATYPVFTTLDLCTGKLSGQISTSTPIAAADVASDEKITVAGVEYTNLCMVYLLASHETNLLTELTVTASATANGSSKTLEKKFSNLPYRQNFRTNLVGKIFTTTSSGGATIDPGFGGDFNIEI